MRISDWSSDVCSSDLLQEIQEVLERDYRTAQRVIGALRERFPELEDFRDEESGRTRWKLPRSAIAPLLTPTADRSEEHTSELQSLMRISYAVFCWKKKKEERRQDEPQPDTLKI